MQCSNERCRFRFPASAAEAEAVHCPRCRGLVTIVATVQGAKPEKYILNCNGPDLAGCLDNIRSIHNVGSMFRTADGAGITHLYLAGITTTPEHPKLVKAALGANETVTWTYYPNSLDAMAELRRNGYQLWALERSLQTTNLPSGTLTALPDKLALIVGNERAGVDPAILGLCDAVFSLPMAGHKSSLNAAVAFGIAVYSIRFGHLLGSVEQGERRNLP